MRAPFDRTARSASAPSSARIDCSGTNWVTRPNGGGSGKVYPVRNVPVAGAFSVGITCATLPFGTSISSCDSRTDSKMLSNSPGRTGAAVANVTRTSGTSLITTVRPNMVASVRMTSASRAFTKSRVVPCGMVLDAVALFAAAPVRGGVCAPTTELAAVNSTTHVTRDAVSDQGRRTREKITGVSRECPGLRAAKVAGCASPHG